MCLIILGHYALNDLYFSSILSSPSNETLTDVPTSSSISVHCELAEPEENDMYWYIPLDVSMKFIKAKVTLMLIVTNDIMILLSLKITFHGSYYSHAQHWLDVKDLRIISVQCRCCKRCYFSSPLCQYGKSNTRVKAA